MTYYIRRNTRPEQRAILRLVVKAGSIDEADDQRGLAHLIEHMAFNGTEHFKPGELVKYLESIGARFGADVNAYTSYDETVYMLEVPTDKEGLLGRGFQVLGDFAGRMTLDTAEIDKERKVVIEEWRLRQGAGTRIEAVQTRALYGQSRYAERSPIGLPEIITMAPAQRLRDFYRTHYRPDRMAVVVVGDIDPDEAYSLIRDAFAGLRGVSAPREVFQIPPHRETRYVAVSDPEIQSSSVSVIEKRTDSSVRTVGDYRAALVQSLALQMFNARFAELARKPDAPFLGAGAGFQQMGRTVEAFTLSARLPDGGVEKGLTAIEAELARVRKFGFGEDELARARRSMLASYERSYNERDKSESPGFASELVSLFLSGEPSPGIDAETKLARQLLPTITADEAAAVIRGVGPERNRVVLAVTPQKAGLAPVTEDGLRASIRSGEAAVTAAWEDDLGDRQLMASPPVPGSVTGRREIPELGVTILTLSNGVDVWLKPTDFKNDQVVFTGYAKGGTSLASPEDYQNASLATSLVGAAGIGGLTPVDLGKLLAGKIANASAYIGSNTHGISGNATPADLETALQLAYLSFTAPNRTPDAFDLVTRRLRAALANQAQSPGAVFGDRVRLVNTQDHYTSRSMKSEDIEKLDPDRMLAYYKARFSNAADFTFFFVGTFDIARITPLLTTYLGSLPSAGKPTSTMGEVRLTFPMGVTKQIVEKGQEPKSQTLMSFFADTGLDELEMHRVNAATSVVEEKLRDLLREELGGTYSVSVGFSNTQPQPGYGSTSVSFGSSPENVDKLVGGVLAELDRLRRDGPTDDDVQKVKETEKRQIETAVKQNGYWLNSLQTVHVFGWDPLRITKRFERTEALDRAQIHDAIRKYFPPDRYTVVTLMPEKK